MATGPVVDNDRLWREIRSNLKAMNGLVVRVGIFGGRARGTGKSGTAIGTYAYFNHEGVRNSARARRLSYAEKTMPGDSVMVTDSTTGASAPAGWLIPPRPFMRVAFDENRSKYETMIDRLRVRAMRGKVQPRQALAEVGIEVRNDIVLTITRWTTPPNAPATIERKRSSGPLRDKLHMRRAVWHQIEPKTPTGDE